jgi:hypothetical protein
MAWVHSGSAWLVETHHDEVLKRLRAKIALESITLIKDPFNTEPMRDRSTGMHSTDFFIFYQFLTRTLENLTQATSDLQTQLAIVCLLVLICL